MSEKLQKIMANAGIGSRRSNEALIAAGRVRVNGKVAKLGDRADASQDKITVDGKPIKSAEKLYIMLNKPRGVLSSTEDELKEGRRTVRDLVDLPGHLYPVGRLDKPSEGLILLTNDGSLAHQLTHPRYEHPKSYLVWVEGVPTGAAIQAWRDGVELDGKKTAPADVDIVDMLDDRSRTTLRVTLREGRKRQIRRVSAELGHPVNKLLRYRLGPLQLGDLRSGRWRHLSKQEVRMLLRLVRRNRGKKNG